MKKILLLGGSAQQIVAIETAKRLGYYTVLCDYLPDNPGQYAADKFYLTSTTDKDAVLSVAMEENVDGVLAYASDPAAPTAAYVAEKMGLPGNPYHSVEILCKKDQFREFLHKNGFSAPRSYGYSDVDISNSKFASDVDGLHFPVIIKPVDSSGSKGVTVLYSPEKIKEAVDFALSFSRSRRIIVEEFIEKKHPYLIGGDIFILDGKIVQWGLLNCYRDQNVNPLVPVGKSFPVKLDVKDVERVQETLQGIVDRLGIRNGPMNVELVIDRENRVWPIDIGPRSGGNMIPDLLGLIFGVDMVAMSVQTAMGLPLKVPVQEGIPYYATYNLHSANDGIYQGIGFSKELEPYIIRKCIYKRRGELMEYFDNASKALGIIFMRFPDEETMDRMLKNIDKYIILNSEGEWGGVIPQFRKPYAASLQRCAA